MKERFASKEGIVLLKKGIRFNDPSQAAIRITLEEMIKKAKAGLIHPSAASAYTEELREIHNYLIMTRKKAAEFLCVSLRTLDRFVKRDSMPYHFRQISPEKRPQKIFLLHEILEWQYRQIIAA